MSVATLPSPTSETAEAAHLRRLRATVERWQQMVDYYTQRHMRVQLRHARRTLEQAQAALAAETCR